ncbi:uncharacterized protein FOMMEDRAFT_156634 [Fomitiporia mediterranea MF3/22]|uniref:uncharacterized protein n=1 Tax=Fomitiporia mediterranea (strain MF3/22) TaxID=694068 RepID=UPI0004408C8D|nr:uncharacterized protein FOMMEDRAFT_156634 [Fomitiporia mediterranea MF3/22]EJD03249.1 hypothetical protein FOMMEDRAFT_156634 [Fomitiporia mediterranea MF3/22]
MSSSRTSKVTLARPTYEADKALYDKLLAGSRATDSVTTLIELLTLAFRDPDQFDRCERVGKDPFISFAEICSIQPHLSAKKPTVKPSMLSNTILAPSRRSSRISEKRKLELSQPLLGIMFLEENTSSAPHTGSRVPCKRKAPLKDINILNCSSEEPVPNKPVKQVRLIVNERPNQS